MFCVLDGLFVKMCVLQFDEQASRGKSTTFYTFDAWFEQVRYEPRKRFKEFEKFDKKIRPLLPKVSHPFI